TPGVPRLSSHLHLQQESHHNSLLPPRRDPNVTSAPPPSSPQTFPSLPLSSRVLHLVSHLQRFGEGSPLVRLLPHLADAALEHRVLAIGGSTTQFAPLTAAGIECRSLGARWNADPLAWARLRQ